MLRTASIYKGFAIAATDGTIGTVRDVLFDDQTWTLRWFVIDTGAWLPRRKVLILHPPSSIVEVDDDHRTLSVKLTKIQIRGSTDKSEDQPVSRQLESSLHGYYGATPYWGGSFYGLGSIAAPFSARPYFGGMGMGEFEASAASQDDEDPHLRSAAAVNDYRIHARDGQIGHVEELLVEDKNWSVRYLVIDTKNWWFGQHVLMSPFAVREISWENREIRLDVTCDQIRTSPAWQPRDLFDHEYERRLHAHYAWPGYNW